MELRQMKYFDAVVREKNFSRAAAACGISQPSLSQQILSMEEELGEPLFRRLARGVEVTEAGYLVHRRVRRILAEAEKIAAVIEDRGELRSGSVVVGMIPTVAPFLLPRLMEEFRRRHSSIQVRVTEARTEDLIDKVVAEEVDFAVLSDVDPAVLKKRSLHFEKLFTERLFLALPDDHPLAREQQVATSGIDPSDVLSLSDGHCLRDQVPERCQSRSMADGEGNKVGLLECEQLSTLQALVAAGLGVAFVPEMSVPQGPRRGIVYRSLKKPVTRRQIALLKRRGRKMSPAARALAECLRELPKRDERRYAGGDLGFDI